jgi:Kdo2-lipid IVA lauroyltransferase/acyltransferase
MSKERSRLFDFAVYALVRFVVCVLSMLSFGSARRFAAVFAWLLYHVDRRHRLVAHDNLRHAFPDLDERSRDEMVRAVYCHFCTLLIEIIHLPRRMHPNNWRQLLELEGGRQIVDALLSGRPLLIVTGHLGNWEMAGYALGLFGFTTHAIARELDNPYLDCFLRGFRERTGQRVVNKNGDFDKIQAVLAGAGVLATLGDQDAGQRGQFVDFFGRPASTHKAVALLALEYNVPMLVTGTLRDSSGRIEERKYRVVVADLILPEEYQGRPDAVKALTERFTAALERLIRRAPEQYFWLHRRWKHQPAPRKNKQAA